MPVCPDTLTPDTDTKMIERYLCPMAGPGPSKQFQNGWTGLAVGDVHADMGPFLATRSMRLVAGQFLSAHQ